ncbi:sulfatase family protein [Tautonia plasticadhaerens]|uniref:Arylsulfatase n=1 Tax=Tautonia plasticadhaerens TaxID=2527974 RepID=A0A518GY80_9BACT|nr:sulfatase [Tautonia plasticadhaerens]QDV33549.1 Arylsulfatase [Tautonia plasticadhaerens]
MSHRSQTASLVLTLSALVPAPAARSAEPSRPNIVFIFADDHAYQAVGAYGSTINRTPNIDRIADEGMLFRRCLVTNSICGPSRAAILTGKYSHLNGFYQNGDRFDGAQVTFPKLLQQGGYETAVFGKWHLETDPTGFDAWHILPGQGAYYNPPMIDRGERVTHEGYTTEIITDLSLEWLEEGRDRDKPFLLMCQQKAPHRNWQPGPKHLDAYKDGPIPEPPTLFDDYQGRGTAARTQDMTIRDTLTPNDLKLTIPDNLTDEQLERWQAAYGPENEEFARLGLSGDELVRWKYQRYLKDYLRCIDSVDEGVGRILDYLDEAGLAENTIVVYSSDQGFYLGEHGWFDKRWMYEESLRTPLLVRWPGVVSPGSECSRLVSNLDFAETFLHAAGVDIPDGMQGRSLVPLLKGEEPEGWRESFYYHYYEYPGAHSVHRHYGVRTDRYKLIHYYSLDEWELFDLARDPSELRSCFDDPQYASVRSELEAELARLREDLDVPEDTRPIDVRRPIVGNDN